MVYLKKVVLITTGGTIASKPKEPSGKLDSGAMSGEELAELCDLPQDIDVEIDSAIQKPSIHLTGDDWILLKNRIEEHFDNPEIDGVVVTHGTDTLEETAYFFDLTIADERPVVVTGSQRSIAALGSDVYINLSHAIYSACHPDLKKCGTVVVFNERIFAARYVKKEHASNIQGFNAFGFGYLGIIDNDDVYLFQKPANREYYQVNSTLPRVDIVKCHIDSDGVMLDALANAGSEGIIIEGVGRGQVAPSMMPAIKRCIEKGIYVVITTSSEEGSVYPTYDYPGSAHNLHNEQVVLGRDFDSKKARVRLSVQLAAKENVQF